MFYSQLLLSKKGALGIIWIAAHCHKKLKKDQVNQTNIISSVDKILSDEVPTVTHRILAYLLLGVVRIYSKKVEYLALDCRDVLAKLGDIPKGKRKHISIEALRRPSHSITLPKRFELDAFNLEGLEDQDLSSDRCLRSHEEIMLTDTRTYELNEFGLFNKSHYEERNSHSEVHSAAHTPVRDVLSPHLLHIDIDIRHSSNTGNLKVGVENINESRFLLEERLEPMTFGETEEERRLYGLSKTNFQNKGEQMNSMENIHESRIFLEERLEPMTFGEAEDLLGFYEPPDKDFQTNGEQMNSDAGMNLGEELAAVTRLVDKEKHLETETLRTPGVMSSESRCQASKECPMPITIDVTPESKFPEYSGVVPEVMPVRTPAAKERVRIPSKRKCHFDASIVVPNETVKSWISDSSGLVCKRRKGPHTAFHVWKVDKISRLPQSFLEPSIPCISLDFRYFISGEKHRSVEKSRTAPSSSAEQHQNAPSLSEERNETAAGSPIADSTLLPCHEFQEVPRLEVLEPATPVGSMEKALSLSEDQELDFGLSDEEINSSEGDVHGKYKLSARTRAVAGYLHRRFARDEDEFISLSQAVKKKTKKESARFFYEILVLKTGDYVDVRQKNAYDDILVLEKPAIKQIFEA